MAGYKKYWFVNLDLHTSKAQGKFFDDFNKAINYANDKSKAGHSVRILELFQHEYDMNKIKFD